MSQPAPFTVFVLLFAGVVAAIIFLSVRAVRSARAHKEWMEVRDAEVRRRAAEKHFHFENGLGNDMWKLSGVSAKGTPWTFAYVVAFRDTWREVDGEQRVQRARDWIASQRLEWRSPAIKRTSPAFSFYRRTDNKPVPGEVAFAPGDPTWSRWRLEARDEALARRVFSPATNALLARLPPSKASNTEEDERTRITLDENGLVLELGVFHPEADIVFLWIDIALAVADSLEA